MSSQNGNSRDTAIDVDTTDLSQNQIGRLNEVSNDSGGINSSNDDRFRHPSVKREREREGEREREKKAIRRKEHCRIDVKDR